jgi:hypothetical protein
MEMIGIKTTIYDFFSYFISGIILNNCIILAIYFTNHELIIPFGDIYGEKLLSLIPNWFLILTIVLLTYVLGIILSTLSSIIIEKIIMRISFLNKFLIKKNVVSEDLYNLINKKVKNDFGIDFNDKIFRLIITSVEKYSVNAYNTAFVFLTIYGMNRNLSMIFFFVGIVTLIINIMQSSNILFALILIVLSILTFVGYIRFYRYFISQILSAYINTNQEMLPV